MIKVTPYKQEYKQNLLNALSQCNDETRFKRVKYDLENDLNACEYLICFDENDKIIGYSKTTPLEKGFIKLDDIFVLPSLRRDQNGSVILVAVMQRAVNALYLGILAECPSRFTDGTAFLKARAFTCYNIENEVEYFTKSLLPMYKHE